MIVRHATAENITRSMTCNTRASTAAAQVLTLIGIATIIRCRLSSCLRPSANRQQWRIAPKYDIVQLSLKNLMQMSENNVTQSVKLLPQHELFVNYYCGVSRCNATDAARKAKYKIPHMSGWELMQRDDIKLAIKWRFAAEAMSTDELLKLLAAEARGIGDYVDVIETPIRGDDGSVLVDSEGKPYTERHTSINIERMKRDKRAGLIKGVKNGPNGQSFDFVDPLAAQTLLVKIHNLAPDKVDITSKGESLAITPSAFRAAVAKKLGKASGDTETS